MEFAPGVTMTRYHLLKGNVGLNLTLERTRRTSTIPTDASTGELQASICGTAMKIHPLHVLVISDACVRKSSAQKAARILQLTTTIPTPVETTDRA